MDEGSFENIEINYQRQLSSFALNSIDGGLNILGQSTMSNSIITGRRAEIIYPVSEFANLCTSSAKSFASRNGYSLNDVFNHTSYGRACRLNTKHFDKMARGWSFVL